MSAQRMNPELTRSLMQAVRELTEMRAKMIPMERKLDAIMEQYSLHEVAGFNETRGSTPTSQHGAILRQESGRARSTQPGWPDRDTRRW